MFERDNPMTNKAILNHHSLEIRAVIKKFLITEMPSINFPNLLCASVSSVREILGTSFVVPPARQLSWSHTRTSP